ncbi:MAG: HIT family protein [Parcubacteria group bacterium]|jgi:diadenosine tetraphosphate (Ap4A) HIT family hydrolase
MANCIFCKIIKGEIPSVKIWEDKNFLAILDLYPNTKGMTLVMPKKHYDSEVFEINDKIYSDFFLATKKVANILKKGLRVNRVAMVMEGMGVNHAHIKLYPLHGVGTKFNAVWAGKKVFLKKYPGYLTTQIGPQAGIKELQKIAKQIKSNN